MAKKRQIKPAMAVRRSFFVPAMTKKTRKKIRSCIFIGLIIIIEEMSFLNKKADKLIIIWILILSLLYSLLSLLRHDRFQSGGFDLGVYDQAVWQYSQLIFPYNTIKERFVLGDHLTLTLPFLAPLFHLWDDVRILLIFQACWISFSTLAIYKLCRLRKFSALTSFNLSFIYSFFYGIQFAVFFDFHPVVIGVGLIAWLLYFLESGQKRLCLGTLIFLLLTQENMGLALVSLGLIYLFRQEYRRLAFGFVFGGLFWSLLAAKLIAFSSPVGFQYTPDIVLDPIKIVTGFFDSAEKRLVWFYSLGWFSFLPLFSPGAILATIIDLSQYFITGKEFARMWSPYMHHRAILAPFLFLGVLEVLAFLKKKQLNLEKISIFLVIFAVFQQYYFHFPLNKLSKPIYWQEESWMKDNRALFKLIPPESSLATQQNLISHLSHRQKIYLVWPRQHNGQWWLDFGGQPQYLVVDLHPGQRLTQLLESNENFESAVKNMEKADKIKLEKEVNFAKLYRIN